METNRYLIDFYNHYDEDSRLTQQHGAVEFFTTLHYIKRYICLGIACWRSAQVRGAIACAGGQGYAVDAVELVAHISSVSGRIHSPTSRVTIVQGNALDLSAFPDDRYDVTLLLGPLYHLYCQEDKRQALREAIRVTKPAA